MRPLLLAASLCLAACYSGDTTPPDAAEPPGLDAGHNQGMPCNSLNASVCEGTRLDMWCDYVANETMAWLQVVCRGPLGCAPGLDGGTDCDMTHALEGDVCPSSWEGRAVCYQTDAGSKQALQCYNGFMALHHCVNDCVPSGGSVICPAR